MTRPAGVTVDSSVWIPFLRSRRYAPIVDRLVAAGRVWVHAVVLLELYAGTANREDVRDVDTIRNAARALQRLYQPPIEDFVLAGRLLAHYGRRPGRVRPRDHSHDLLIAIGAGRTGSVLLTENVGDMSRWAMALRSRGGLGGLRVRVAAPAGK